MPRGQGGARQGTAGTAYGNRSDLQGVKPLAPTVAPGQTYGLETQQRSSQKVIPMGPPPPPGPAPAPAPTGGTQQPAGPPATQQQQLPPPPAPGDMPPLNRPSERPGEHVMSGAPLGPGPGPGALNLGSSDTLAATLGQIAAMPGVPPEVAQLAAYVNSGRR